MTTRGVAGVDGCRGGWVAVALPQARLEAACSFGLLLRRLDGAARVAVDVPIGLLDDGASGDRACDKAARRELGWPRRTSVFPPPTRAALGGAPARLTAQTRNILPKVREVDGWMRRHAADEARVVVESHPELGFFALAKGAMRHPKRTRAGRLERWEALRAGGVDWRGLLDEPPRRRVVRCGSVDVVVQPDDLLDACVLAWTAQRVARGEELRLGDGGRDAMGLPMEILA